MIKSMPTYCDPTYFTQEKARARLAEFGVTDDWYGSDGYIKPSRLNDYVEVAKRMFTNGPEKEQTP